MDIKLVNSEIGTEITMPVVMQETALSYFDNDSMAADAWSDKYKAEGEVTPDDMHRRMAREFARIEWKFLTEVEFMNLQVTTEYKDGSSTTSFDKFKLLSQFGQDLLDKRLNHQTQQDVEDEFFSYFKDFATIVPQGGVMANLGVPGNYGTLSNCFVIEEPSDSYGGIFRADEELIQLMKKRGGVGTRLDKLRPEGAKVNNPSKTSTGVTSFAERYSNSTREVAQNGRRGALMLLLHCEHPDIFKWVKMKADRTKVTGANVSVMFTDKFMQAVEKGEDFICTFPIGNTVYIPEMNLTEYNVLTRVSDIHGDDIHAMRIRARALYDEFIFQAWENAEPGAAYIDRIQDYSPDGVYEQFRPTKCNPCGEIWMGDYDACRLIAMNFLRAVENKYHISSVVNLDSIYEIAYMQQRLGDNLVELELEAIRRIIHKAEGEPAESMVEINLWKKVYETTSAGRRTGNGFTALADMLAALGMKYDSDIAIDTIDKVMYNKMRGELDATIDMAITRGAFKGWDRDKEYTHIAGQGHVLIEGVSSHTYKFIGKNSFFEMLYNEFPKQAKRMYQYGRRNVSWSTVAPTGTVSVMTQTSSGLEPIFKAYYIRRRKIVPGMTGRVDFTDQSGDSWQEYPVLHHQFKEWIKIQIVNNITIDGYSLERRDVDESTLEDVVNYLDKETVEKWFKMSPWYGSQAEDISWEKRIQIQAVIQKYTSNSISSTINLPNDIHQDVVHGIYLEAWRQGLKGVTVYRDGSRSGVLISTPTVHNEHGYKDAVKRPPVLEGHYYHVVSRGKEFAVVIGLLNNNPYELFAFHNPLNKDSVHGEIHKLKKGQYSFVSPNFTIDNLQLTSDYPEEAVLTRLSSLLLRHGASPKYVCEQIEKAGASFASFARSISRILKKYNKETSTKEKCLSCGEETIIYEEGCKKCTSCGSSKC